MKHLLIPAILITGPAMAAPEQFELDPTHTAVMFEVTHLGYAKTIGLFPDVSGTFTYDTETRELSDVNVTIKAASVNSFNKARDKHVKKSDFLNVKKFPEITFTADQNTPTGDTTSTVTGDLTLLGTTHPITLNVTLNKAGNYPFGHKRFVLGLSLSGEVQRSEYGMTYAVKGDIVGDTVGVRIETEAMRLK